MSRVILYPCLPCGQPHTLCYLIRKSKKVLGLNCDFEMPIHKTTFVPIPQATIDVSDLAEKDLVGIPEFVTGPAREKLTHTQNYGLPLMIPREGETVERNVDLPRIGESDEEKAKVLLAEIAQLEQAQKEIENQLKAIANKGIELEKQEREKRKKLREVWTQPLDLKADGIPF